MVNIHGGDIYSYEEGIIDFSSNINPLGAAESVINAAKESMLGIGKYPDAFCRKLRKAISEKESIGEDNIICSNGAAELIFNIVSALKPKNALFAVPTFSEYEQACKSANTNNKYYYLKEENDFEMGEDILDYIDESIDIFFICSPNNPTGKGVEKSILIKILKKCSEKGVFLVIDECFEDFSDESTSMKEYIYKYKNMFILKAFTKMYAMAGLRLGYGICGDIDFIESLYFFRQPWSVSTAAQEAGAAALKEKDIPEKTRKYVKLERDFLYAGFEKLNIKYFKSQVNFILFKEKKGLDKKLIENGILIRNCISFTGLQNDNEETEFYRTAVKSHRENKLLIEALRKIKEAEGYEKG